MERIICLCKWFLEVDYEVDNFDYDDESDRDIDILDVSDEDENDDNDDVDVLERFFLIVKVVFKESDKEKSLFGNIRCNYLYVGYMK